MHRWQSMTSIQLRELIDRTGELVEREMQLIGLTSKYSRIITLVILLASGPALAQPDTRRGFSLAREHCAQCHAIDNAGESPLATAPPFRELHLKYAISDLQRPLTQGPHTRFHFEPSQIEALMAYLKTVDRRGQ
jgi:mono/diheme cytochrome c family protein